MGNWKIENCSCVPSRDRDPAHNSKQTTNYALFHGSGARFSKLPVITGPVKLFCFSFHGGISEDLKIVQ